MVSLISFPSPFLPLRVELNYLSAQIAAILLSLEILTGKCTGAKTIGEVFAKEGRVRRG